MEMEPERRAVAKRTDVELCDDVQELVWKKCANFGVAISVCRAAYRCCSADYQTHLYAFMSWRTIAKLSAMRRPLRFDEERLEQFENRHKLLVVPLSYARYFVLSTKVAYMLFYTYWGIGVRLRRHVE